MKSPYRFYTDMTVHTDTQLQALVALISDFHALQFLDFTAINIIQSTTVMERSFTHFISLLASVPSPNKIQDIKFHFDFKDTKFDEIYLLLDKIGGNLETALHPYLGLQKFMIQVWCSSSALISAQSLREILCRHVPRLQGILCQVYGEPNNP